jgi:hypothetical protein
MLNIHENYDIFKKKKKKCFQIINVICTIHEVDTSLFATFILKI